MAQKVIHSGTVHKLPEDLRKALVSSPQVLMAWEGLTPLARNEWICWIVTVKQSATRINHVRRTITELKEGKRRPCCWMGCIHRPDKPISSSVQWVLSKQSKSK